MAKNLCKKITKRSAQAVNWCFTINNYSEEEYNELLEYDCNYIIIGKEKGKEGTPHLQGYIQLKKQLRNTGMKKINKNAHWEIAKGDYQSNHKYCSKDGDYKEAGSPIINGKKRVDMVKAVYQTIDGVSKAELLDEHGAGYIMNKRKIDEVADVIRNEINMKKQKTNMEDLILRYDNV